VQLRFSECAGTRKDKQTGKFYLNDRWSTAKQQMLTKCTEAAALREAFPDELGGTHTAEEMEGQDKIIDVTPGIKIDPRGDVENVDFELANKHVSAINGILNQDKEEHEIASDLRDHDIELSKNAELACVVFDKLAEMKIITKANYRKYLNIKAPV
jgi:hypothetical protein